MSQGHSSPAARSHRLAPDESPDESKDAFIRITGVTKRFKARGTDSAGQKTAVDDVSLTVAPSEFISLIGPSGCGKTTILRMLAGLEKPTAGQIIVGSKIVKGTSPDRAVVFQQPALLPWATVLANVALGLRFRGENREVRHSRARAALDTVGLSGFEDYLPRELSGGMQQRVALARALVLDPLVLLMDEPFASLDEITRRTLQAELLAIWAQQTGRAGIFITHSVDEALILSDRVVIMSPSPGRIEEILDVRLPRPRRVEHDSLPEFVEAKKHIWKRIEQWQR